ncbi:MAG: alanine racemase [Paracoccaceae bacterium]
MSSAVLTIDLDALARNWRGLNAMTGAQMAAVVKADGYGLGAPLVARRLMREGVQTFFVAIAEEGQILRDALGPDPDIFVFSGHMSGDTEILKEHRLIPLLNSVDQMLRHFETLLRHPFGIQLDTGMNRLGVEPAEWAAVKDMVLAQDPKLVMSHLACADEPSHPMNAEQLRVFKYLTDDLEVPKSLSATGGTLLGPAYHFDMCRPGIGLYGGMPYRDATTVVTLDIPVIQVRDVQSGESVGYGNAWVAQRASRIATISAGYADGLIRAMGPRAQMHAGDTTVPVVGRVSMDLITVDITDLSHDPRTLQLLGPQRSVDTLADMAGTIGYEILTSLGARYTRQVIE